MPSWKSRLLQVPLSGSLAVLALSGCGQFFPPLGSGGGGGGTGSSSGNYIYVGNLANAGSVSSPVFTVAGFSIASGSLGTISGSNWDVIIPPTTLAITSNDGYLYVGSTSGGIYLYIIGSSGALSLDNNVTEPVATGIAPAALRVDTTGNYLIGVDGQLGEAYVFGIDSSTGALTSISSSTQPLNNCIPTSDLIAAAPGLVVTPNDDYVFVSCGTSGVYGLSFSSSGTLSPLKSSGFNAKNGGSDYGLAVATSGSTYYLLAAETGTGGVRVFPINSDGSMGTEVSGSPFPTGTGAGSVLVDSTNKFVYVANRGVGNISAFTLSSSGTLTSVGSAVTTGILPTAMVEDKSDAYLAVINTGGSQDLQVFTINSTTGALTSLGTQKTGTDPTEASSIAATH